MECLCELRGEADWIDSCVRVQLDRRQIFAPVSCIGKMVCVEEAADVVAVSIHVPDIFCSVVCCSGMLMKVLLLCCECLENWARPKEIFILLDRISHVTVRQPGLGGA